MTPDQAEVLGVLRRQEAAIARGDAKASLEPMSSDVVLYELPPPLEHRGSRAQGETALADWFASWDGGVATELTTPTIIIDGDLAVVFGLSRMRGIKKGEGYLDRWNRRTVVLRRDEGGQWRIVHEHASYPLHMDGSGKAALDLHPET